MRLEDALCSRTLSRAVGLVAVAVAVVSACGARAPGLQGAAGSTASVAPMNDAAPSAATRTEDEVSSPSPPAEANDDEVALARRFDRLFCRKGGCCVSHVEDGGHDRKGRAFHVVTLDMMGDGCVIPPRLAPAVFGSGWLDREPSPYAKQAAVEDQSGYDGPDDDSNDSAGDQDSQNDCHPYQYHLVTTESSKRGGKLKIRGHQLLAEVCNNGYGAAGVGEDEVSVDAEAKTFTHRQEGGSAWRGSDTETIGFEPFRRVETSHSSFWTGDEDGTSESSEQNWDLLQATQSFSVPDCAARRKEEEERLKNPKASPSEDRPATMTIASISTPRVALPATFVSDGWRTTGLGNCGGFVDGDKQGWSIFGAAGKAADASMRYVLSEDGVLFVEITDDHLVTSAPSWLAEDHLELWMAPAGTQTGSGNPTECPDSDAAAAEPAVDPSRQWGLRIANGEVIPAFGKPTPLAGVEVVRSGHGARFKIPLGATATSSALTIVYSDSDDGKRQKRLIATSQLQRRRGVDRDRTLGTVWDVDPSDATCAVTVTVKGKALRIVRPTGIPKRAASGHEQ